MTAGSEPAPDMSEPNPPRRPLATFLRPASNPAAAESDALPGAAEEARDAVPPTASPGDAPAASGHAGDDTVQAPATALDDGHADAGASHVPPEPDPAIAATPGPSPSPATRRTTPDPGFLRGPVARLHIPRWQWMAVGALAVLLLLQIALADRAQLAASAGTRPWIEGLCNVLRCSVPAWHEPTAFTMTSRDVRPVVAQAGALQVQASIRNDARWAQAWPMLRLSLSDADGRVIGTGVFRPADYLEPGADAAALLEPGQSAQIAFRVREPAASTVAFTFEFM